MNKPNPSSTPAEPGFLPDFLHSLKASVIATFVLAVIVSGAYPLVVWALAQGLFHYQANGSLIDKNGKPVTDDKLAVGSALLGQGFSDAKYFHPRPSAAGSGYDGTASGGSNLGPTSAKLLYGTTKNYAVTLFANDKSHSADLTLGGHRVQATVAEDATKTTIVLTTTPAAGDVKAKTTTYTLDPSVVDPKTVVSNYHGRSGIHSTTIKKDAVVELTLDDAKKVVTAINVVDQEIDGTAKTIDTTGNKITLSDDSATVINVDPANTVFVVNGSVAKLTDITTDMALHAIVSSQVDNDGIADRVIHYCQDNNIKYASTVPDSDFTDADGLDDVKLINAFNAAKMPTITPDPAKPIPADAVTASGSGLDPHISPANAHLQAQHVADARKMNVEKVKGMITACTDGASLGFLGEAGVNVLRLNLALDVEAPVAAPAPAPAPTAAPAPTPAPTTAPTAAPTTTAPATTQPASAPVAPGGAKQ